MKNIKQIIVMGSLLIASTTLNAQNLYDANRVMGSDLNGTARFVGMGGALGALGGDISTMGTNPAGIGIYRSNDAMVSFGFGNFGTKSNLDGSTSSTNKFSASFDNAGFVFSNRIGNQTALRFVNFGFNYHKVKSFSKSMLMNGMLSSSQTEQFAAMSNRPGDPNYMGEIVENSVYRDPKVYSYTDVSWLGAMAYKANLINPYYILDKDGNKIQQTNGRGELVYNKEGDPVYLETYEPYWNGHQVDSKYSAKESGGLHAYDFNVAFNFYDRFYLGATLGVYSIDYNRTSTYSEVFLAGGEDDGNYSLRNRYSVGGSGVDFKLGFILRPFEESPFKIGVAVHTPTWYRLTERNLASLDYDTYSIETDQFERGTVYPQNDMGNEMEGKTVYQVVTPWKFNLSLGYTIGKTVALGAEYEYSDYSTAKLKYDDGAKMDYENKDIESMLRSVHTLRLGAEFKIAPEFAFRLGYNHITAPMKSTAYKALANNSISTSTEYANVEATNNYVLGLGYRGQLFYADVAYQYNAYKEQFYAFDNVNLPATKVDNNNHKVVFTLGLRF